MLTYEQIIHDRHEKIGDIDDDRIVMVGDLYHRPAEEVMALSFGHFLQ